MPSHHGSSEIGGTRRKYSGLCVAEDEDPSRVVSFCVERNVRIGRIRRAVVTVVLSMPEPRRVSARLRRAEIVLQGRQRLETTSGEDVQPSELVLAEIPGDETFSQQRACVLSRRPGDVETLQKLRRTVSPEPFGDASVRRVAGVTDCSAVVEIPARRTGLRRPPHLDAQFVHPSPGEKVREAVGVRHSRLVCEGRARWKQAKTRAT